VRGVIGAGLLPAVLAIVLAPILASFFALLADRLPRGEPVLAGRSRCRACGRRLGLSELVPLLSFLWQRGRCRGCGRQIPRWIPAFELAALALALQGLVAVGPTWPAVATTLLAVTLLAIAVIDLRHFVVPDALSLPLLLAGLGVSALRPETALLDGALGATGGFLFLAGIREAYFRLRGQEGLGLGDAKLLAAGGAWAGWQGLPFILLAASASGLLAVLIARLRGRVLARGDAIPFGPALALGIWLVWLYLPPI